MLSAESAWLGVRAVSRAEREVEGCRLEALLDKEVLLWMGGRCCERGGLFCAKVSLWYSAVARNRFTQCCRSLASSA